MKAKLTIDGKEFNVEISKKEFESIPGFKTGYEEVPMGSRYYVIYGTGRVGYATELRTDKSEESWNNANYYSDKAVAENNARADRLIRQLRKFAVEHREKPIDWNDSNQLKYYFYYGYACKEFIIGTTNGVREPGQIYFDTVATAKFAISTFKSELLWYFTEYKDSL